MSAPLPPRAARKHAARRRGWAAAVALVFWLFSAAVILGVAAAFEAVLYGTRSPYQAHAAGGMLAAAVLVFALVRRAARLRRPGPPGEAAAGAGGEDDAAPGTRESTPGSTTAGVAAGAAEAPRSPALDEAERAVLERAVAQAFPELRQKAP